MRPVRSVRSIRKLFSILACTAFVALAGCGGGNSSTTGAPTAGRSGAVTFSVHWPVIGRLVPAASQSVSVVLTLNGQQIAIQTLARPANGGTTSATFSNVIASAIDFTASAFPSANGTGIAQATGSASVSIMPNTTSSVNLTMDSTIARVGIVEAGSLAIRNSTTATATAFDTSGSIVLTASSNWKWASSNPDAAAVSTPGETATISGITAGTVNITATEAESGKSIQAVVTVLPLIAFIRTNASTMETYTMYPDGTHLTRITTGDGISSADNPLGSRPSWFPDNNKMAYANYENGTGEIYSMNADGTGQIRLTSQADQSFGPDVSPDGKRITFARSINKSGPYQIWVMNVDGSNLQQLTSIGTASEANIEPLWSHSGQYITFISTRNGFLQVFTMNADGSSQTAVTNNPVGDDAPSWSPDDTRIVFSRHPVVSQKQLYTMYSNGTGLVDISNNASIANIWEDAGAYSPDGKLIAFTTNVTGTYEIFTANPDGSGRKQLTTSAPGWSYYPSWSH